VKKFKVKVRKAYNRIKSGQPTISRGTEATIKAVAIGQTKCAGDIFEDCIKKNEGNCWTEFYKYVKRRKGNRENIPAIKDISGRLVTDSIEKANTLYL
jgi:oligoribonuclease NrnB/cAMP/cGMP phosphodiesterase (DHH superfamily)